MLAERRVPNDLELIGVVLSGHGLLEPTSQVVVVPEGFDTQYPAAGGQAGVRRGLVPVPQLVADQYRVRLLLILDRVIDDQDVRTLTGDTAPDAGGGEAATLRGVPRFRGLGVRVELGVWKNRLVVGLSHDLAHLPRELHRQFEVVTDVDELVRGVVPQVPSGEADGRQLALAVARRHQNHQAGGLLLRHLSTEPFEPAADIIMNPAGQVRRVGHLSELEQAASREDALGQQLLELGLTSLGWRHRRH